MTRAGKVTLAGKVKISGWDDIMALLKATSAAVASHADVLRGSSLVPGQERVTNP